MAAEILIVDDEADIRDLVAGILQDEGYITRTARDSDDALAAIVARAAEPGLSRYLAAGQQARRAAIARCRQAGASRTAGRDDFRSRQHRNRGRRHQAGRLRLHRKAVQGRPAGAGRRARAGNLAAQARGQGSSSSWRRYRRRWSASRPSIEPAAPDDRTRRADQQPHLDRRPVRRGQGTGGAHAPSAVRRAPTVRSSSSMPRRSRRSAWKSSCSASSSPTARKGARSARSKRRMAARCSSTKSPTCRARPRTRSCACWSTRPSSASAAAPRSRSTCASSRRPARNLEAEIADGNFREDLYHRLVGRADPRAAAGRAARGHSRTRRIFHGPDFAGDRPAEAPDRRGRDGGAAVARLAGQCPPAAQQRRAADDPRRRRPGGGDHRRACCRRMSARWCRPCRAATAAST